MQPRLTKGGDEVSDDGLVEVLVEGVQGGAEAGEEALKVRGGHPEMAEHAGAQHAVRVAGEQVVPVSGQLAGALQLEREVVAVEAPPHPLTHPLHPKHWYCHSLNENSLQEGGNNCKEQQEIYDQRDLIFIAMEKFI